MSDKTNEEKLLYSYILNLDSVTDYGISLDSLLSEKSSIPEEGVRQDVHFKGTIEGHAFNGSISGTDYLLIKESGEFSLNIFATITTSDHKNISLQATGTALPTDQPGRLSVSQTVSLLSNDQDYRWINSLSIRGEGHADMQKKQVIINAYYSPDK